MADGREKEEKKIERQKEHDKKRPKGPEAERNANHTTNASQDVAVSRKSRQIPFSHSLILTAFFASEQ